MRPRAKEFLLVPRPKMCYTQIGIMQSNTRKAGAMDLIIDLLSEVTDLLVDFCMNRIVRRL